MTPPATVTNRRLLVMAVNVTLFVAAFLVLMHPDYFGASVQFGIWGFFSLMILNIVLGSIGARWIQAARPPAVDPAALTIKRTKFLAGVRSTMALCFGVGLAVFAPFIPEAKGLNLAISVVGGGVVGSVIGWLVGHLMGSDIWASAQPRIKK
jgi:hypothetical protein